MTVTVKKKKAYRYGLSVTILVTVAVLLGAVTLGSAFQVHAFDWLASTIDMKVYEWLFIAVVGGVLGVWALLLYLFSLNPYAARRPRALVFLNILGPTLYVGMAMVANDHFTSAGFSLTSQAFAPAVILGPPVVLLIIEALLVAVVRGMGIKAQERTWRESAVRLYKFTLAFRPEDKATRRRAGMLCVEDDETEKGLPLLEPIEPVETSADEEFLKALEHCYRAQNRIGDALRVLLRLQQLHGGQTSWVDRRILDDYLKLELDREALELIESGRLKMTLEIRQIAERLNLRLGNFAQAMALIRQIATEESKPNNMAIRLYREMHEKLPYHIEVKINLGLLLIESEMEERRREGAALLESVLEDEPQRLHLARRLVQFYSESGHQKSALVHIKALVEAGDPDPEYHLVYAQMLADEEQYHEAIEVLTGITRRWPDDWRGHMRLARAFLALDRLEEAKAEMALTTERAPGDAAAMLEPLRAALEQRHREVLVMTMREDLARNGYDVEKRLELIDHQLAMEWVDDALAECDRLLDEIPALLPVVVKRIEVAVERQPRSFSLRAYLSDIYFRQERYDETLRLYREMAEQSMHPAQVISDGCRMILTRVPRHQEARRELALARRGEGDWFGVLEALDPPIHNNEPIPTEDKLLWVEAAFRLSRLDGAVRVGLSMVEELVEEVGFMLLMIDILTAANEFDKALEVFNRAKAANPKNDRLLRIENKVVTGRARHRLSVLARQFHAEGDLSAQEHYEKAELHRMLGQNEESIVHYQRAAYDPAMTTLATAKLAETLCDRGMFELADETLDPLDLTREIVETHPELKELMYRVGRALEKMRRFGQALKYYKRIFRVDAAYEDIVDRIERLS